jgi:invasion protein IalB
VASCPRIIEATKMRMKYLPLTLAAMLAATPALAQAPRTQPSRPAATSAAVPNIGGAQPTLLGQYGDWGAYTASPAGKKLCFALAKPVKATTNPPNRPRDPSYMFISSRPAEKVKDEVSLVIGYGFKPATDATLDVAGSQFAMYTQNDGAWIKNAADEGKLVETLRRGTDAVVKGTSARGTATTDTYSLKGLAQALDKVGQECK